MASRLTGRELSGEARSGPRRRASWAPRRAGAGFSFLELVMVVAVISILAALAVPYLHRAKMSVQEKAAQASLRTVFEGEALFHARFQRYGGLDQLVADQFIDRGFVSSHRNGYDYQMDSVLANHFELVAVPTAQGVTGDKSYYVDETGVIRYTEDGSRPTASSPPWK